MPLRGIIAPAATDGTLDSSQRPVEAGRQRVEDGAETGYQAPHEQTLSSPVEFGLRCFVMYIFDFGAPVGFRLAERHPNRIAGLVVQNGNAYEDGLSPIARQLVDSRRGQAQAEERIREPLTLPTTQAQYLCGATDPDTISPDG